MIALLLGALLMCAGFSVFVLLALHRLSSERDRQDGAAIRYVRGDGDVFPVVDLEGRTTGLWFATGPTIHAFETWAAALAWVTERTHPR